MTRLEGLIGPLTEPFEAWKMARPLWSSHSWCAVLVEKSVRMRESLCAGKA